MRNVFAEVEYVGTDYFGFQIQNKGHDQEVSVQGVLEQALSKLFGEPLRIQFASRTDRGVHAQGQVINFKIDSPVPIKNIKEAVNALLPHDVRIKRVRTVADDFHARFCAVTKRYKYTILNRKEPSVFWHNFAWHIPEKLDITAMQQAADQLIGKHDFSVFAKNPQQYKSCVRRIMNLQVKQRNSFVYIEVEADGFLRYMVRNMVTCLVHVGKGQYKATIMKKLLLAKITHKNHPAPAAGLCLMSVIY